MIYRLIKFENSSWSFGFDMVVILSAFALFRIIPLHPALMGLWTGGMMVTFRPSPRCTLFQAALPICGRDIYCARVLSEVGVTWLMVLAMVAGIQSAHRTAGPGVTILLFEVGAILTLGHIAVYSVRTQELNVPRWWRVVVWAAMMILLGVAVLGVSVKNVYAASVSPVPPIYGLAVCALASAIWFGKTWTSFPESFQVAPGKPGIQKSREHKSWLPSFAWSPVLRTFLAMWPLIALLHAAFSDNRALAGLDSPLLQTFCDWCFLVLNLGNNLSSILPSQLAQVDGSLPCPSHGNGFFCRSSWCLSELSRSGLWSLRCSRKGRRLSA